MVFRGLEIDKLASMPHSTAHPSKPHSPHSSFIKFQALVPVHGISHSKLQPAAITPFFGSIMSWERRGAERHSRGSRWAHRPTLAESAWMQPTCPPMRPAWSSSSNFQVLGWKTPPVAKLGLNFCLKLATSYKPSSPNRSISLNLVPVHITS